MSSIRGRLLTFALRHRHTAWKFWRKPPVKNWQSLDTIQAFRTECEQGAKRFGTLSNTLAAEQTHINGIHAEWIRPHSTSAPNHLLLFFHGGGYVAGSCADHRMHLGKYVTATGIPGLQFNYRLAPEHPYPAALEDSLQIYQQLLGQGFPAKQIALVGLSAGGGLALALLLALREHQLPLPAGLVALSPWTDLSCSGTAYTENAATCLAPQGIWTACSRHYCGRQSPETPLISPLFGDLTGLPPLYLCASDQEILRDDTVNFARKARQSGVEVTLEIARGLFHCFPVCTGMFPEATQAFNASAAFLCSHLDLPLPDHSKKKAPSVST